MANASLHDQRITKPDRHINPGFDKVALATDDAIYILNRVGPNADGHRELPGHELVDRLIAAGHLPDASLYAIDRLVTIGKCTAHPLPDDSPLAKPNRDAGYFFVRLADSVVPTEAPASDTVRAHREKLFPHGLEGIEQDLVDRIVRLDTLRPNKSDAEIAREFYGESAESSDRATKALARIRRLRQSGRTSLSART